MSCQTMTDEVFEMLQGKAMNSDCPDYNSACSDYVERVERSSRQMDWDKALDLCGRSSVPCSEAGIDAEHCRAVAQMYSGAVYHAMGDLEEAENCYRQSVNIFSIVDRDDSRWCEAVAQHALGLLAQSNGNLYEGQRLYHRSYHLFQRLGKKGTDDSSRVLERILSRKRHLDFLRRQRQKAQEQVHSTPIIGTTAAGEPILAIEVGPEDVFPDRISLRDRDCKVKKIPEVGKSAIFELELGSTYFALQVKGHSMTWVDIEDGDYVIFRHQHDADPGDIVVVRIDDLSGSNSTVKRFNRQGQSIILKAENPEYQPQVQIFGSGDPTIEILGKAVAVVSALR
jgi:SOS-response transcriptional repressor LexA